MTKFNNHSNTIYDKYQKDGYVIIPEVLDRNLIDEMMEHVAWLLRKHPRLRPEQLHHTLVADDPFWVRVISDERLLDVAEQFIGPDIALFASHYICKPPRDGQAVLWHQDGSYWPLSPMNVVTLWIAMDESKPDNGCMRIIPGTQSLDLQELKIRNDIANVLGSGLDESQIDDSGAVNIILSPGDVSIHDPNVFHGSKPNTSERWRRSLTIRYIPTSTQVTDESWPCVMLLRGNSVKGINHYIPYPRFRESDHFKFNGWEKWI